MSTDCIEVSLEDNPIEVLKVCSGLLSCLDKSFEDNIYNYQAMKLIADVVTDAVSRLEDEAKTPHKWGKYKIVPNSTN